MAHAVPYRLINNQRMTDRLEAVMEYMRLVSIILTINYIEKLIIVISICWKYWINKRSFFVVRVIDYI